MIIALCALCFAAGSALTLAGVILYNERQHKEYVRDWQTDRTSCAIIRTRHRRSERHTAPMPLDMYQVQLDTCGQARGKRINGRWS